MYLITRKAIARQLKLRFNIDDNERGAALITVVGILSVLVIVCSVVLTSSVSAAGFATSTRADVQSRAAANAGIEAMRAKLASGNFVCGLPKTTTSPIYQVANANVHYYSSSGSTISCPSGGVAASVPTSATIISNGWADSAAVAGNSVKNTASMGANLAIQSTPGGFSLSEAIFTDGALTLQNGDVINQSSAGALDADIYSNGAITCPANGSVDGTIYSQGALTFSNSNCVSYGTVWVKGDVSVASVSAVFKGSIYATGAVTIPNSPVGGSVIANGNVTLGQPNTPCISTGSGNSNVCGSVYSLGGSVVLNNYGGSGSKILGSVYSRTAVTAGSSGTSSVGGDVISLGGGISGPITVGGRVLSGGALASTVTNPGTSTRCSNGTCTPANLVLPLTTSAAPAFAVQLPMFDSTAGGNLGSPSTTVHVVAPPIQYIPQVQTGTAAWATSGWTVYAAPSSWCNTNNQDLSNDVSTKQATYSGGTSLLIDFSACSGQVTDGAIAISMKSSGVTNLAFYLPHGISISNGFTVGSSDSAVHNFDLISPSNASGVTWSGTNNATPTCSGSGPAISSNSGPTTSANAQVFIYTPCQVSFQNNTNFKGQVYSGSASYPSNMTVTIPAPGNFAVVPGLTIPGGGGSSATYSASVTNRYNVNG